MLQAPASKLVGRAVEFGRLTRVLDQAAAGEPMVALVSGDAGMGKTRLVAELATVAAARGFMVLSGRCAELGDSVPYLPLADALRSADHTDPALRDAIAARPVLGLLLPDRGSPQLVGSEVSGMAQQQLFGAVLGMLAELAEQTPVLLVLEDMHWADRSTRDLLTFLSRVLHRERVALIATYRTDDLHRGHPLRAVAAELLRLPSVTAIEVGRCATRRWRSTWPPWHSIRWKPRRWRSSSAARKATPITPRSSRRLGVRVIRRQRQAVTRPCDPGPRGAGRTGPAGDERPRDRARPAGSCACPTGPGVSEPANRRAEVILR